MKKEKIFMQNIEVVKNTNVNYEKEKYSTRNK